MLGKETQGDDGQAQVNIFMYFRQILIIPNTASVSLISNDRRYTI